MLPFIILLLVPIVIQHIGIKGVDYQKKNRFALAFFFVLLTFLVMFRHKSVGNDTRNYIHFFEEFSRMDWSKLRNLTIEVGYAYLNKFVSIISSNPQFFLAVAAVAVSAMIFPTYKRLCRDSSLTIVLFCALSTFVMMFSGIRQMLAIGLGFVAYEFTRNKKFIAFLLCVAIAMLFHSSAFMLLLMYPLYHARITKKWLLIVVPAMVVVFVFNRQIFGVLTLILQKFSRFDGQLGSTGAFTMLLLFIIFAVFAYLIPDEKTMDAETIGLRNFLLLSIAVQLFAPLHNLAMRMNYYYIIFIPLLLPKVIAFRRDRYDRLAIAGRNIMIVFFLIYFFINAYKGGSLNVFPYHFFWENVA